LALAVVGLGGALDAALREAVVGTEGDVVGDEGLETSNVLDTETVEGGTNNVWGDTEVALSDLEDTRILVVESSDEHGGLTAVVLLKVDSASRENGGRARGNIADDEAGVVLSEHTSAEGTVDGKVELGCTRVGVGGVQAAGSKESDGHGKTIANDGGEVLDVCSDCTTAISGGDTSRRAEKVKDELIIGEEGDPIHIAWSSAQLGNELGDAVCAGSRCCC